MNDDFARAVIEGLRAKPPRIPSLFHYDAEGSRLFEQICEQPEYYLTGAEAMLLEVNAPWIVNATGPVTVVELGAGNAAKTGLLLEAYAGGGEDTTYVPIDVSPDALRDAEEGIRGRCPSVEVVPVEGVFEAVWPLLSWWRPVILLFLGSTFGNFDDETARSFFQALRVYLPKGSYFLLGVDLVKDPKRIEAAYNDAAGVTEAFTLNVFARMNRELDAGVDLSTLRYESGYNEVEQRIETYVRFAETQDLHVAGHALRVDEGTRVLVEISRKFEVEHVGEWFYRYGLHTKGVYQSDDYALLLAQAQS